MSYSLVISIHCDKCSQWIEPPIQNYTIPDVPAAKKFAKQMGWTTVRNGRDHFGRRAKHLCPTCSVSEATP